jgi:cytochrome c oxidase cbb3-type subunit 3
MRRHLRAILTVTGLLALVAGCQRGVPGDLPPVAGPPPVFAAIGPIPGPDKTERTAANPFAKDRGAIAEGRTAFNRFNCSGCHGDHAGGGMGPSLRDVDWIYGSSDAQVYSSIAQGRAHGMPAWGTRLNDDQIWKLVAYVHSLRTPLEADPPR